MVRIDYLKMENLISVMAGMGKEKIEIDFTKGRNNKILLIGANGSGKSVILSSCTPYRGTNDNRSVEPLEGKTGMKEIHYTYNNDKYIISHYYGNSSSKNKSYITKNGEELNENGNIRPFNDIIEEEMNISPDYFTVGRLGSNVSNFIDYTTADRKKYINKFIPNIDEYSEAFDIVNTKLNDINKRFKSLNVKLEKYRSLEEIKESKDKLEKTISSLERNLNNTEQSNKQTEEDIEEKKELLEEIRKELSDKDIEFENIDDLINLVTSSEEILNEYIDKLKNYEERFPSLFEEEVTLEDLRNRIPELKAKININEAKLENNNSKIESNNKDTLDLKNDISIKESRIDSFNEENIEDLEKDMEVYLSKKENIINELNDIKKSNLDIYESFEESLRDENLRSELESLLNLFQERYNNLTDQKTEDDIYYLSEFNLDTDLVNKELNLLVKKREEIENLGNGLTYDLNEINKSSGLLDILEHSEDHDHAKDCPFVPMALNFKNEKYTSIGELENKINELEIELKDNEENINSLHNHLKIINLYNRSIYKVYEENIELLSLIDISEKDILDLFSKSFVHMEDKVNTVKLFKRINLLNNELDNISSKIDNIDEKIKYNISFQNTINEYREDINSNKKNIDKMEEEINDLEKNNVEISKEIQRSKSTIAILNQVIDAIILKDKQEELAGIYNQYRDQTIKINDNITESKKKIKDQQIMINRYNQDLNLHKVSLENTNRDYFVVESSLKELNIINEVLDYFETIKNSLDIKKGIPLIFTNTYLIDIAERTNELLSIAYDGAFSIEFEVTKKDFNIIVNKSDGTILDDISLASQGETSMTNTSLSLAMMANVTKGYNILYLDEVDATLDNNNRRSFLSVLDRQIEILGSEQVFIISHNDEFYSADVDLILLNGYESRINIDDDVLMNNKKVLYVN